MSNLNQTGRHVADAAKEGSENFKSAADSVSDTAGNYTSEAARDIAAHFTRKAGKRFARARDAAVDAYDDAHDRAVEYPHITLGIAVACGFLLGAFLARHR